MLDERSFGLVEVLRIELLQQPRILFVQAPAQIVDRVVDAVVETPERGIVRRRRSVGDDRVDLLARFLRLLFDVRVRAPGRFSDARRKLASSGGVCILAMIICRSASARSSERMLARARSP